MCFSLAQTIRKRTRLKKKSDCGKENPYGVLKRKEEKQISDQGVLANAYYVRVCHSWYFMLVSGVPKTSLSQEKVGLSKNKAHVNTRVYVGQWDTTHLLMGL